MAKSNAERQATYRARSASDYVKGGRVSLRVSRGAEEALDRLAACYAVTKQELLTRLILDADQAAKTRAERQGYVQIDYFGGRVRLAPYWD